MWILQVLVILVLVITKVFVVFFLNGIIYILKQFTNFQEKPFV